MSSATLTRLALAALLAVLVGRIVLTYAVFNDTFDEGGHIRGGLEVFQRGTYTQPAENPPLGRLVVAALPYFVGGLRLDGRNELWGGGEWATREPGYFWKTLALARAGNLLFVVVLLGVVYRWSAELYGRRAGVAACLLAACCPNLIAHASLATLDIGATATTVLAAYCFWRWRREPGWRPCLVSAAAFGAAVLVKISAPFFLPPLLVLFVRRRLRPLHVAALVGLAFVIVWAGYGFQTGIIVPPGHGFVTAYSLGHQRSAPNLLLKTLGPHHLPAHKFVHAMIEMLAHNVAGHRAYLLGRTSDRGWWYYFPVAVALKTTLPLLALVGLGVALRRPGAGYPLVTVLWVLAVAMSSQLNLGVRHVLGIYPFLAILASAAFGAGVRRPVAVAAWALAAWHAGESVAAHPDYLAYFNQLGRGREERLLLDSNLDWGQDLARLGEFVRERRIERIGLSYFGSSSPAKMGIPAERLEPGRTATGWIAVSVNHLVGLYNDPADFAWLRREQPVARVGKSIWVYYLPGGR